MLILYVDLVDHDSMNSISYYTGPYIPYYVSVAASTSIGKGDVKAKVAFTEQGGVCMSVLLLPASPCPFLSF